MHLKHGDDTPWECVSGHRGGGIEFRPLLAGAEGAKDNHHLSLWRESGRFFSPRHRHNFDQVRICLEGEVSVTPGSITGYSLGRSAVTVIAFRWRDWGYGSAPGRSCAAAC